MKSLPCTTELIWQHLFSFLTNQLKRIWNFSAEYGYGTLAVLLISLLAFVGLLFFPILNSQAFKLAMQFFIALGVGTLSGDAILHIFPEVRGQMWHMQYSL